MHAARAGTPKPTFASCGSALARDKPGWRLFAAPEAAKTFGITGAAIVDGVIFGITGIAIWRFSAFGTWFGLGFFTLEKVYQWTTQPKALTGIVVAVALWLAFYNGVRGAMALRKMKLEAS